MTGRLQTVTVIMSIDEVLIDNLFCSSLWTARQAGRAVDNYRRFVSQASGVMAATRWRDMGEPGARTSPIVAHRDFEPGRDHITVAFVPARTPRRPIAVMHNKGCKLAGHAVFN
jgi:hypothetical protein